MDRNRDSSEASSSMLAEIVPPRILPRVLSPFDLVTIYFALIFGSYGAAQMAAGGWAALPMMGLAALTFLAPCAMCSYELGTLFPGEGGIYIWAHKTLGPIHGFVAGWLSWVPIFLLLPLGATTIVAHLQVALAANWPLWVQVGLQLLIVVSVTTVSVFRLRLSQGYVRVMFFVSLATAVLIFLAGLFRGQAATPMNNDVFSFSLAKHGNLYSAAILWLLGVEVPFNMGAEFKDHRKVAGTMLTWGSLALLAGYFMGIVGVLWITPLDKIDATTGVAKAALAVSPLFGLIVSLGIVFAISSQDVAYMNSYSRLLFISGIEHRLPEVVGQVTHRSRVPIPALLIQALGAAIVILIFSSQTNLAVAFNLYIAALVTVWCSSLFYLYVGVVRARRLYARTYRDRRDEIWTIPGGSTGLWAVAIFGAVFNAVAIYYVFALPLTADITPHVWRIWLIVISVIVAAAGIIIFKSGERRAARFDIESTLARYATFDGVQK